MENGVGGMVLYKRSGRFKSFRRKARFGSVTSPDFYSDHRINSRNPGAVAMGSTIRLRSGTIGNF
ncbi:MULTISPECIES: hypothetical protein [unclassified Paenibacillus]|uniref:hypothetical protein n=1 Tax=unclassified Paenibacillus TaxID=185978 RepID=UPI0038342823